MFERLFNNKVDALKIKMAKKVIEYRKIRSQYDCGNSMFLEVSSEARKVKSEIEKIHSDLLVLDPDNCPKEIVL